MKDLSVMSDNELLEELNLQNEWSKDDAFEFATSGRGDNGFVRANRIVGLYEEAVKRGLRDPLSPSATDDPDFEAIKKHMEEIQGFEWCGVAFRKWGKIDGLPGDRRQVDYCSWDDAAAKWHRQYVQHAQEMNR